MKCRSLLGLQLLFNSFNCESVCRIDTRSFKLKQLQFIFICILYNFLDQFLNEIWNGNSQVNVLLTKFLLTFSVSVSIMLLKNGGVHIYVRFSNE